MAGWIKLYRSIQSHWLWESEKPFDKRSAWIDILLLVNHNDNKVFFDNEIVYVKRGEHITSEPKLAERWGWSRTKVRNFLNLLEKDGMIENKKEGRKRTRLIVLNYNDYQDMKDNERTENNTTPRQEENKGETKEEQEEDINKNEKNEKNEKNSICMYDENLKNVVKVLEENIGIIPPILIDEINEYSKIFDKEMFSEAVKIASNKKRRHVNYVIGILKNWKDNNIITIDDLEALRKEKEIERQQKQQQDKKQSTKTKSNRFHNFKQRTDSYTADQLEDIARRKREEYFKKVREG